MFDWDSFLARVTTYPPGLHRLLPPCPEHRLRAVELELGKLPATVTAMLRRFNGGELFFLVGPMISLFRIDVVPPLPPLEWAPDWCIEKFTPKWRAAGSNRDQDWAIGMTCYGGLILLDAKELISEWDTGETRWLLRHVSFGDWMEGIFREGEASISELRGDV